MREEKRQGVAKKAAAPKHINRNLRTLLSIWVGKTIMSLTRIFGQGGTTLPGRIALKINPQVSAVLSSQLDAGSLIITGTNGKTTTTALINGILKEAGLKCIHNQSGSNLAWGVASTLIESSSWWGRLHQNCAVLEVDEGSFPEVVRNIKPRGIIATNIFRDQLDRFGEIDHIQNSIKKGIENLLENSFKVINADDPSLAGINPANGKNILYYGLELDLPAYPFQNTGRDIKVCPLCSHILTYDKIYFAHLGHYRCEACKYKRPLPAVKLTDCQNDHKNNTTLEISTSDQALKLITPLMGTYNLYNILAAIACALELEIPSKTIIKSLDKAIPSFGRMEPFEYDNKKIVMALIKNPVGTNEVLRTVLTHQDGKVTILIAINDNIADGTDISWLWDADFEQLHNHPDRLDNVIVSGSRAWDMAVRLKYSGLEAGKILVEEEPQHAINKSLEHTDPGGRIFILPNYTAMLELRRELNRMGMGNPYWNREEIL